MRLVYICSPLKGDIEGNQRKADEYCAYAADCGVIPLAPHTIFTRYLDENIPEEREQGLKMGQELLKHCNEIWVMGNEISIGMQGEINLAKKLNLPILYLDNEMVQSGYKIRQEDKPLDKKDIIPGSERADFENQIVVVDPNTFNTANITADDSLWLANSGFGCCYGRRGQSVFAESILTGETIRFDRCDILGIVDPKALYLWICDKPIKNENVEAVIKNVESDLTADLTEEMEVEP